MNNVNLGKLLRWMIKTIEEKGVVTDASVFSTSISMVGHTESGLRITIRIEEEMK